MWLANRRSVGANRGLKRAELLANSQCNLSMDVVERLENIEMMMIHPSIRLPVATILAPLQAHDRVSDLLWHFVRLEGIS